MTDSRTHDNHNESHIALIFAFIALAGSIVMGLLSNFAH